MLKDLDYSLGFPERKKKIKNPLNYYSIAYYTKRDNIWWMNRLRGKESIEKLLF